MLGLLRRRKGAAPSRRPALPVADWSEGTCRICGMHEPGELVDGCHPSCVEWLGYRPRPAFGGTTTAEVGARLQAAFKPPRQEDRTMTEAVERLFR